jgi:hypothetical protein
MQREIAGKPAEAGLGAFGDARFAAHAQARCGPGWATSASTGGRVSAASKIRPRAPHGGGRTFGHAIEHDAVAGVGIAGQFLLHRDVGAGGGRHAQDDAVGRQRLQLGLLQQMRMRDGKDAIKRRQRGKHVRRFQQRQGA